MGSTDPAMQKVLAFTDSLRQAGNAYITYTNGQKTTGRVMCTFDSANTGCIYILFTDETKTPDGLYNAYAAKIDPILGTRFLFADSMDYRELDLINDVIKKDLSKPKGLFKKVPICRLQIGGILDVHFN